MRVWAVHYFPLLNTPFMLPWAVGGACHDVLMDDVLRVDLRSDPVVITAPLPASVIRNGEIMRQLAVRREWDERRLKGDVSGDEDAPPVPGGAVMYGPPAVAGVVVGAVLFLIVQLVADVLGRLFGFRPGLVGLWIGLAGGAAAGFALLVWGERTRARDARELAAGRREISDPSDRAQMLKAHRAAVTVIQLWPEIPLGEGPAEPRLHAALWQLSEHLLARRRYADTLAELRRAGVGLPPSGSMAQRLGQQIKQADALFRTRDETVRDQAERLAALVALCRRFCDEHAANERAQQVSNRAHSVLGPALIADRDPETDARLVLEQLDAMREAYRSLPEHVAPGDAA